MYTHSMRHSAPRSDHQEGRRVEGLSGTFGTSVAEVFVINTTNANMNLRTATDKNTRLFIEQIVA